MPTMPPKHRPLGWRPPEAKRTDPFYGSQEWKRLRALIRERDRGQCRGIDWRGQSYSVWFCGRPAWRVDHIKPRTEGGPDEPGNLRLLCSHCDARRHAEKGTAWRI